jgi:nucleoside 2-deoxyribosyltransferase
MVAQPPQPSLPRVKQPPLCYVASPLGFSEAGRHYLQTAYLPVLSTVVTPIDPWSLVGDSEVDQARRAGRLRDLWLEIGRRNTNAIRSSSLLVALLDGQEADSGTVAELGYAAALGKTCFGLRSDLRQCGEEDMVINLQIETFVLDSGGEIVSSLANLIEALRRAVESISD